jgi:hypothetical protein
LLYQTVDKALPLLVKEEGRIIPLFCCVVVTKTMDNSFLSSSWIDWVVGTARRHKMAAANIAMPHPIMMMKRGRSGNADLRVFGRRRRPWWTFFLDFVDEEAESSFGDQQDASSSSSPSLQERVMGGIPLLILLRCGGVITVVCLLRIPIVLARWLVAGGGGVLVETLRLGRPKICGCFSESFEPGGRPRAADAIQTMSSSNDANDASVATQTVKHHAAAVERRHPLSFLVVTTLFMLFALERWLSTIGPSTLQVFIEL